MMKIAKLKPSENFKNDLETAKKIADEEFCKLMIGSIRNENNQHNGTYSKEVADIEYYNRVILNAPYFDSHGNPVFPNNQTQEEQL